MNIAKVIIGNRVTVKDLVAVLATLPQDYIVLREDDARTFEVTRLEIWHDPKEVIIS